MLSSRRETTDGGRPVARHLDAGVAAQYPLPAFALLEHGDLFDPPTPKTVDGLQAAATAIDKTIVWSNDGDPLIAQVRADMVRQLAGNPRLAHRMGLAKPIRVDLVGGRADMIAQGYPRNVAPNVTGLFWDHPDWSHARIALRRDGLAKERALVIHEYAHAIHYLGMTRDERDRITGVLRPVFGHPADQDEVFAIYSEREFIDAASFSTLEKAAPGIYGVCRRGWNEDHVFAAFVKKLYRPGAKVRAGDKERAAAAKWKSFLG